MYTRELGAHERVPSLDEKTSIQPRSRLQPTQPAKPDGLPVRVEHEYKRAGALHLFAAFDTRTGRSLGILRKRKRTTPASVTVIHVLCDNLSIHSGKLVQAWLAAHPWFRMHLTPVHCSWMNQIEQWFSILQRKRLRAPNFADLADLEDKILAFIAELRSSTIGPAPFSRNAPAGVPR